MSYFDRFTKPLKRSAVAMEELACMAVVVDYLSIEDKGRLMMTCLSLQEIAGAPIHWQKIVLTCPYAEDPNAMIACLKRTNTTYPLLSLDVQGESAGLTHDPHCEEDDVTCESCAICTALTTALPGRLFHNLESLVLHRVPWLTACVAEHILANAPKLQVADIQQNVNANRIVRQITLSCHDLEVLSFKYIETMPPAAVETYAQDIQADIEPKVLDELASSCIRLRIVSLNHYLINEDVVEGLLKLRKLELVDLSDNEGLHGFFLSRIPQAWPNLRVLKLRDCTELQETAVQEFVALIVRGACTQLTTLDLSCQWAHVNQSFITNESLKAELAHQRPQFQWIEDHCQIPGFGIDPDEEIWYTVLTTFWLYYAHREHGSRSTTSTRAHALRFLRRAAVGFSYTSFPTAAP